MSEEKNLRSLISPKIEDPASKIILNIKKLESSKMSDTKKEIILEKTPSKEDINKISITNIPKKEEIEKTVKIIKIDEKRR